MTIGAPLISLELRWFLDGAADPKLEDWFEHALLRSETKTDTRTDIYLLQGGVRDVGIKIRQRKPDLPFALEVKCRSSARAYASPRGITGVAERWLRWGWIDPNGPRPNDIQAFQYPKGMWVPVRKKRLQRKYKWDVNTFLPESPDNFPERGAAIELTHLDLSGKPHVTVLVETFAPDEAEQARLLDIAVETFFRDFPGSLPLAEQSRGYPEWLSQKIDGLPKPALAAPGNDAAREFVNLEYTYLTQQFLSNEEMGEKRVSMFLTLTAGLGAAALLAAEKLSEPSTSVRGLIPVIGATWIAFGYLTFVRILNRNNSTDDLKEAMQRVRAWYAKREEAEFVEVLPYSPYAHLKPRVFGFRSGKGGRGGYAELVAAINSVLVAAVFYGISGQLVSALAFQTPLTYVLRFAGAVALLFGTWKFHADLARETYGKRNVKESV